MKQRLWRFGLSAFLYLIVAAYAGQVLEIPTKVIHFAIFIPPILGLIWGPVAAVGVCVGGLFAIHGFHNLFSIEGLPNFIKVVVELFLAGYLPYILWHKWQTDKKFSLLTIHTLKKLVAILFITFLVTSIFRTVTVSANELDAVTGLFGFSKKYALYVYFAVCLLNDFFVSVFFDLVLFFFLIGKNYQVHNSSTNSVKPSNINEDKLTGEENKALIVGAICYAVFPAVFIYLDTVQIYGMNNLETWMNFVIECFATMDTYIFLIIYLLLRYRRSIMMEIVFLVALTVFLSAAVLGWGSSVAMTKMVNKNTDNSLHGMSVICRERLDRTFFCIRQAVNGMEAQAIQNIESYNRLAEDTAYRENFLATMEKNFSAIAMDTDGCLAYYLRLAPEIAGGQGGFSMARKDNRWEGALSPFVKRSPIDISAYSPDDRNNVGWFYIPLKSKCATWIEPYIDPAVNAYVISYVAPIFIEGKFIGVIGADIDFNFIIQELRRMSIYNYGYVYMMNRNNIVLYHKDRFQGSVFQPNPEFKEIEIYLANGMWLGIATPLSEVHSERNNILMHLMAAILIVAMLVSVGSIVLVSSAIKPLAGMTEAAKRIASGDLNVKISYESGNELGLLVRSIREMANKLEIYVYRDKLTGLRNAAAYISKGAELNTQSKLMSEFKYAVVIFDVNFLKKVNDNYGHQAGNQLLRHASRVICKVFEHSPVYRTGGDEFAAILEHEDYEHRDELIKLFDEKIAEEYFVAAGNTINVSVARGIYLYEPGMEFAEVAKKADSAMYIHKTEIKAKYGEEVR